MPIVRRQGQSVELTDAGKHLVALAGKVLEEIQATERSIAKMSQQASGKFAHSAGMPYLFRLADSRSWMHFASIGRMWNSILSLAFTATLSSSWRKAGRTW